MSDVITHTVISVVIVDDDAEVRNGLEWMINHSDGFRCDATFGSADEILAQLTAPLPDVVLMDIGLPGMSGIECVRELKKIFPQLNIIMQTVYSDDEKIFESLRAGAIGYILKKSPILKLLQAISDAAEGGVPMSGEVAKRVLAFFRQPAQDDEMASLSQREHEVLEALIEGRSYKAISEKLFLSIHTVRFHVHHIYEKLHVRSRAEFMAKVMKHNHPS
ncbi:MAG: response regulator transcription factor [Bacteroidetes bacterium]|nr:response regulator transcription factor [Bacteroidota bacterium]